MQRPPLQLSIVSSDPDRPAQNNVKIYAGMGVRYERTTPDGGLPVEPNRYAALLVRIAVSQRRAVHFLVPRAPKSDLLELRKDIHAMTLLNCDKRYYHPIWNQILQIERRLYPSQ